jgi:hypothetical protein
VDSASDIFIVFDPFIIIDIYTAKNNFQANPCQM